MGFIKHMLKAHNFMHPQKHLPFMCVKVMQQVFGIW